jgi:hypothetical protein
MFSISSDFELLSTYALSPIKIKRRQFVVPDKYLDVLHTLQSDTSEIDYCRMEATMINWRLLRETLVTGYWMDCWYSDECTKTPKTIFLPIDTKDAIWPDAKFIRLNSLSTKSQSEPMLSMNKNLSNEILSNRRCVETINIAKRCDRDIVFAVRDWINLKDGLEWRCFIYEDALKAICLNDSRYNSSMPKSKLIERVENLLCSVKLYLPCVDCVMDVWIHDSDPLKDILIEFNSYGFWGNSTSGLFDWVEDGALLYNPNRCDVIVRT